MPQGVKSCVLRCHDQIALLVPLSRFDDHATSEHCRYEPAVDDVRMAFHPPGAVGEDEMREPGILPSWLSFFVSTYHRAAVAEFPFLQRDDDHRRHWDRPLVCFGLRPPDFSKFVCALVHADRASFKVHVLPPKAAKLG